MSIDSTLHLSKLSHDEIKTVHQKWPNPFITLGFMTGGIAFGAFSLLKHSQGEGSLASLIGGFAVFICLVLGSSIFGLIKVAKARKILNGYANQYSLPQKELLKEFKQNLKHMKDL